MFARCANFVRLNATNLQSLEWQRNWIKWISVFSSLLRRFEYTLNTENSQNKTTHFRAADIFDYFLRRKLDERAWEQRNSFLLTSPRASISQRRCRAVCVCLSVYSVPVAFECIHLHSSETLSSVHTRTAHQIELPKRVKESLWGASYYIHTHTNTLGYAHCFVCQFAFHLFSFNFDEWEYELPAIYSRIQHKHTLHRKWKQQQIIPKYTLLGNEMIFRSNLDGCFHLLFVLFGVKWISFWEVL